MEQLHRNLVSFLRADHCRIKLQLQVEVATTEPSPSTFNDLLFRLLLRTQSKLYSIRSAD